jgi:hypothetical protein
MTIDTNDLYTATYFITLHAFLGRSDIKPMSGNNSIELAMAYSHDTALKVVEQFNDNGRN